MLVLVVFLLNNKSEFILERKGYTKDMAKARYEYCPVPALFDLLIKNLAVHVPSNESYTAAYYTQCSPQHTASLQNRFFFDVEKERDQKL